MKNENNTEVSIKNQHRLCVFCCSEDFCNYITPEKNNMNPPNITTDTNKKTFIFSFNYNDIKSVDDKEKFNITPSKDKHLDTSSYNVLFLAGYIPLISGVFRKFIHIFDLYFLLSIIMFIVSTRPAV